MRNVIADQTKAPKVQTARSNQDQKPTTKITVGKNKALTKDCDESGLLVSASMQPGFKHERSNTTTELNQVLDRA